MKQADSAAPGWKARAARHKCSFIAWLSAWVTITFVSAAIFSVQQGKAGQLLKATWHNADDVPPYAKLTLGALLILLLAGFSRLGSRDKELSYLASALAGLLAMAAVFLLAPFRYYPAGGGVGAWMLPHLLVGAIGGCAFAYSARRCRPTGAA